MKKVIEGKLYNTDTAELIAEWGNSYGRSDFKWCAETLYRTRKGSWFIYGEGGAMSRYSRPAGNMQTGGSDIRVLTEDEAMEWLEQHDMVAELEEHFGSEIEEA